eukprot:35419_1
MSVSRSRSKSRSGSPFLPETRSCFDFIKTGDCRYGNSCRFIHEPSHSEDKNSAVAERKRSRSPEVHYNNDHKRSRSPEVRYRERSRSPEVRYREENSRSVRSVSGSRASYTSARRSSHRSSTRRSSHRSDRSSSRYDHASHRGRRDSRSRSPHSSRDRGGHREHREHREPRGSEFTRSRPCFKFVNNGECQFGDDCKYSHDMVTGEKPPGNPIPKECRDFFGDQGCRYGKSCRFAHERLDKPICREFLKNGGNCSYGDRCKFSHSMLVPPQAMTTSICFEFMDKGTCKFGATCRRTHMINPAKVGQMGRVPSPMMGPAGPIPGMPGAPFMLGPAGGLMPGGMQMPQFALPQNAALLQQFQPAAASSPHLTSSPVSKGSPSRSGTPDSTKVRPVPPPTTGRKALCAEYTLSGKCRIGNDCPLVHPATRLPQYAAQAQQFAPQLAS